MTSISTQLPTYVQAPGLRLVCGPLSIAERRAPAFAKPRPSRFGPAAALGIRYENRVNRALGALAKSLGATLEKNPWFHFVDNLGHAACSPDSILWLDPSLALVIEIKYTWTPLASIKLAGLYVPVINAVFKPAIIRSMVICKTLTPDSPPPISRILEGTQFSVSQAPVYQWLGQGPLLW